MGDIDNKVHYMVAQIQHICSNLIIKSVIVFCEIISLLTNVWRPVKSTRQTQEAAYRKDVSKDVSYIK